MNSRSDSFFIKEVVTVKINKHIKKRNKWQGFNTLPFAVFILSATAVSPPFAGHGGIKAMKLKDRDDIISTFLQAKYIAE